MTRRTIWWMAVVIVCGLAVLAALALTVRWRAVQRVPAAPLPRTGARARASAGALMAVREAVIVIVAGIVSGLLLVGPAARLAMRLLAVTAGEGADGRLTEAGEVVGRITVGGTIGLVVFVGLGFGVASSLAYGLTRWLLPAGVLGGLVCGALLLAVIGPRADPLRPDNPDFAIVGPGWLAVAVFLAMALAQGAFLATLHARLSRRLPTFTLDRPRSLLPLLTVVPFLLPGGVLLVGSAALGAAGAIVPGTTALRTDRARRVGQLALGLVGVLALPGLLHATTTILGSFP